MLLNSEMRADLIEHFLEYLACIFTRWRSQSSDYNKNWTEKKSKANEKSGIFLQPFNIFDKLHLIWRLNKQNAFFPTHYCSLCNSITCLLMSERCLNIYLKSENVLCSFLSMPHTCCASVPLCKEKWICCKHALFYSLIWSN